MANFGRTDAEGEGAKGTMRRRMAVAANNRLARLSRAQFRPDNMHYPTFHRFKAQQFDTELPAIGLHLTHLHRGTVSDDLEVFE